MTEITSEQHEEATVSLGTYCSVCACTRVCDTGWRCVTVAYRVPEPRAKESSLIKVKRSDPTNLFSQNEFCIVSSPATTESMQLGFCIVSSPATESMQEVCGPVRKWRIYRRTHNKHDVGARGAPSVFAVASPQFVTACLYSSRGDGQRDGDFRPAARRGKPRSLRGPSAGPWCRWKQLLLMVLIHLLLMVSSLVPLLRSTLCGMRKT